MMGKRSVIVIFLLVLVVLMTAGCYSVMGKGSIESHSEEVGIGDAKSARVEILMGAGKLEIRGGGNALLEADLRYSHRSLAPDIDYHVRSSGVGILKVEQDDSPKFQFDEDYLNEWDLALTGAIPLELNVTLGAGESELDLSDLDLESFTMQMGAGESTLDLRGYSGQDLEMDIQGGVGELTVLLPSDARIEAEVRGGLGEINAEGLGRQNGLYRNDYSGSGPEIKLKIEAGIGQLNLLVD